MTDSNAGEERRVDDRGRKTTLQLEQLEARVLLSASSAVSQVAGMDVTEVETADGETVKATAGAVLAGYDPDEFDPESELSDALPGASLTKQYDGMNVMEVGLPEDMHPSSAIDTLRYTPGIDYAEPDQVLRTSALPNDPDYGNLWGMEKIDAPDAWDTETGSDDVVVGVIDTGIDYTHEDLAGNIWTNPDEEIDGTDTDGNGYVDDVHGYDFLDDNGDPMPTDPANEYHGTHVAGTIGAVGDNATGVAGVNWDVKIASLRIFGPYGRVGDIVEAINYSTQEGFPVTNNSWGGPVYNQAVRDAIQQAHQSTDQLFVAAAGNDALNTDVTEAYPASYDLPNIVSVAATDEDDQLASFSNFGEETVDLAAPGVSIYSTLPNDSYGYLQGTSMASPHVAGVAALLEAQPQDNTALQIKDALMDGADGIETLQGITVTGGRLNAARSLQELPVPFADVRVAEYDVSTQYVYNVSELDVSYTIENAGAEDITQDFGVGIYLSENGSFEEAADHKIREVTVPGLNRDAEFSEEVTLSDFPSRDPFGTSSVHRYNLLLVADNRDDVDESSSTPSLDLSREGNNDRPLFVDWSRGKIFEDDFSTDKGWTGYSGTRWERGPARSGAAGSGNPDPAQDHSPGADDNVLGYEIGGTYRNNMQATEWIESPIIGREALQNPALDHITISFYRWLNAEGAKFDKVPVQVYDDSTEQWVQLNPWRSYTTDTTDDWWVRRSYHVGESARGNDEFRVRFGVGPTDGSRVFSGWNIDDFSVEANFEQEGTSPAVKAVRTSGLKAGKSGPVGHVTVQFDEDMAALPLGNTANYGVGLASSFPDQAQILAADAGPDRVELTVGLDPDADPYATYQIGLNTPDLFDTSGNPLTASSSTHTFSFPGFHAGSVQHRGGTVTFYDTDAPSSTEIDTIRSARVAGFRGISRVTLTPQYSDFGVAIEQASGHRGPISIVDRTSPKHGISFVAADSDVSVINLRSPAAPRDMAGVNLSNGMTVPDESGSAQVMVQGDVNRIVSTHGIHGAWVAGDAGIIQSRSGGITNDVTVNGRLRLLTARGDDISGDVMAGKGRTAGIRVIGGDITGDVDLDADFVGQITAIQRAGSGGNITGDITVDGRVGAIAARGGDIVTASDSIHVGSVGRVIAIRRGGRGGSIQTYLDSDDSVGSVLALRGDGIEGTIEAGGRIGIIRSTDDIEATIEGGDDLGRVMSIGGSLTPDIDVDGRVGAILAIRGDINLQDGQIAADDTIGSIRTVNGSIVGDADDSTEEVQISGGNLWTIQSVRGDLDGISVSVNGDPDDGEGSIGRALAVHADNGIVDSRLKADNRINLVHSSGAWDPATRSRIGGDFRDSSVEARELGRVIVTGQITEDDDGEPDKIHAAEGSFFVRDNDDRAILREGDSPKDIGGVEVSVG